ncbi:hypothetical protein HQ447_01655 [bacterium]|nr:hypothetical protein [bacterium]
MTPESRPEDEPEPLHRPYTEGRMKDLARIAAEIGSLAVANRDPAAL